MNYRNNAVREISEFAKEFDSYSLGEVLYAVLRGTGAKTLADLMLLEDQEIYTSINKAIEVERND